MHTSNLLIKKLHHIALCSIGFFFVSAERKRRTKNWWINPNLITFFREKKERSIVLYIGYSACRRLEWWASDGFGCVKNANNNGAWCFVGSKPKPEYLFCIGYGIALFRNRRMREWNPWKKLSAMKIEFFFFVLEWLCPEKIGTQRNKIERERDSEML